MDIYLVIYSPPSARGTIDFQPNRQMEAILKIARYASLPFEPRHEKTNVLHMRKTKTQISFAVTAKLSSAFLYATRTVQSPHFLHPKFQASSHLLELYSLVCVGPGRKPELWSSRVAAHMFSLPRENLLFSYAI